MEESFELKIHDAFPGLVVKKDLVKLVKGNAVVPSYVLEYLLGQYCATDDEESVKAGIESVKEVLAKHYVHRNEANKIRSEIAERGQKKVIDVVAVTFNEKKNAYEAAFSNLGINKVRVEYDIIKKHPKLLVHGVWCIAIISYNLVEDLKISPWSIESLKPIQMSSFDSDSFIEGRNKFNSEEWVDVLVQSIGFNPEMFSKRLKLLQLLRMVPFVERNYNLIELGPKGTGKSFIYSEFSPYGMLLSGGEVTLAKLFVNNSNGQLGLVGYWDVVAFDEFAGQAKKVDKSLVDVMKNYMANKSFSRGVETMHAEASMAFEGNTKHPVPYMLKNTDLFEELPTAYHDSAFIDRIHAFVPGWEFDSIRSEMFTDGSGFIVDYLAEMLRYMRNRDYSNLYQDYFTLSDEITIRDKDGINKTFSGLMKLIFPDGKASKEEIKEILTFAVEHRKRVKDQLVRIDPTFYQVSFDYTDNETKEKVSVKTVEETCYPSLYYPRRQQVETEEIIEIDSLSASSVVVDTNTTEEVIVETEKEPGVIEEKSSETVTEEIPAEEEKLKTGSFIYPDYITGISYEKLFAEYLKGAKKINVQDPYIQKWYQRKNFMEFIGVVAKYKKPEDIVDIKLVTKHATGGTRPEAEQIDDFLSIRENVVNEGINFTHEFDNKDTLHARSISTDTGWRIILDRGLDIFQAYNYNDQWSLPFRVQETRKIRGFEVTYVKQ